MNIKKLTQRIIIGVLIMLCGLVFLLDAFNVAFDGAIERWYLVITITFSVIALAIAVINKSEIFLNIALLLGGIYLACNLAASYDNITTFHTWPIITIMVGIGIFISGIINKRRIVMLSVGAMATLLSTMLLIGLLMNVIKYMLPAVIILIGVSFVIYSVAANFKTHSTPPVVQQEDYYVRPSIDNNGTDSGDALISSEVEQTNDNNEKSDK